LSTLQSSGRERVTSLGEILLGVQAARHRGTVP
jgi:hypothetical protein